MSSGFGGDVWHEYSQGIRKVMGEVEVLVVLIFLFSLIQLIPEQYDWQVWHGVVISPIITTIQTFLTELPKNFDIDKTGTNTNLRSTYSAIQIHQF